MNENLRGAKELLRVYAEQEAQKHSLDNAPDVASLLKRSQVAKSAAWQQIRADMKQLIDEVEAHLHFGAHTIEEIFNDRGASNALVRILEHYESAEARMLKLQQDAAAEGDIGSSPAE
ncbi:MAG: hypothetical protein ACXADY_26420 [Candidatus Hodarchaeales archaeon]